MDTVRPSGDLAPHPAPVPIARLPCEGFEGAPAGFIISAVAELRHQGLGVGRNPSQCVLPPFEPPENHEVLPSAIFRLYLKSGRLKIISLSLLRP